MYRKNRQRIAITVYSSLFFLFLFALAHNNPPQTTIELNSLSSVSNQS